MASLYQKAKVYYVQLSPHERKSRPRIRLGVCSLKDAREAFRFIERLANRVGSEIAQDTLTWLDGLPDGLRDRLSEIGLVEAPKGSGWTLAAFMADYIERRKDVKPGTRQRLKDAEKKLNAFFRGDRLEDVTQKHAENFRIHLKANCGMAENTVRRHIAMARQFFTAAISADLITRNPFLGKGQPVSVRPNESKFFYVTREIAQKVLDACPDAEWRLIFGLARFGGLRCPSEVLRLKWTDVDFEHNRFTVHASKTEHHANEGIRTVPMFPELKPLFQDAFDNARTGAVYCVERQKGGKEVNLRTQFERIVKRAGLDAWPKLFQNCRSTRETELFKQTGGNVKAVCKWIGNTPAVAMAHYAQVQEADLRQAAESVVLNDAEKSVHNTAHETPESECRPVQDEKQPPIVTPDNCTTSEQFAPVCTDTQKTQNSGKQDSNLRPPGPKPGALAKLSYSPWLTSGKEYSIFSELSIDSPKTQYE